MPGVVQEPNWQPSRQMGVVQKAPVQRVVSRQRQVPGVVQYPLSAEQPAAHTGWLHKGPENPLEHTHVPGVEQLPDRGLQPSAQMAWSQFVPFQPCAHTQVPGTLHEPPLVSAQPARQMGMSHWGP